MLSEPAFCFTIPSVRDDVDLASRVYHPARFRNHGGETSGGKWAKKGAVVAHPYAPLGGCFDDPIVSSVASVLLRNGYVVGTFNFRGAGASKGHTTWTAKGETDDYVSFLGFFIHYVHSLDPPIANPVSSSNHLHVSGSPLSPIRSAVSEPSLSPTPPPMQVVLGGYSYGSLIAMNLPGIDTIMSRFEHAIKGSAEAEIRLRAAHMSQKWNREVHERQRDRSLTVENIPKGPSGMLYGGEESEPGTRRPSRESRRSVEIVRRSVDRSRKRLSRGRHTGDSDDSLDVSAAEHLESAAVPEPRICFLLISPVLPPVSSFATMFSGFSLFGKAGGSRSAENIPVTNQLSRHPTLAVYGDKDFFTSSKKLDKWATQLTNEANSLFRRHEIVGAGHFWHEDGVESTLQNAIKGWLSNIE